MQATVDVGQCSRNYTKSCSWDSVGVLKESKKKERNSSKNKKAVLCTGLKTQGLEKNWPDIHHQGFVRTNNESVEKDYILNNGRWAHINVRLHLLL